MAYDYKNLKQFQKSQVNGLTKKLSSFRFMRFQGENYHENERHREIAVKQFMTEVGLKFAGDEYEHNADAFHFVTARKITAEQTSLGKAWLKEHFFKKDGSIRSGKKTENVGDRVLKIAKKVTRFEFIGVLACKNSYGEAVQYLPIYRTYSGKDYFDYAPIHWGQPVIMEGY